MLMLTLQSHFTRERYLVQCMHCHLVASGWMDGETFHEWFEHHFLEYAPSGRYLLLLLDGHSSHYNPPFIRCAAQKGVIVFALPPNTTHISQPLDGVCFKVLK